MNQPHNESTSPEKKPSTTPPKTKKLWVIVIAGFVGLAVLVGGMTAVVYSSEPTSSAVRAITSVVPYPAVRIGSDTLTFKEFLLEYDALTGYYAETGFKGDPPDEHVLQAEIIGTMINKEVVRILADEYGVELDQARVGSMLEEAVVASGGADVFEEELQKTFGWSIDIFTDKVIAPIVLAGQMEAYLGQDESVQAEPRASISAAHERLEAGEEFSIVASETNQDRSAIFGGDLGYILASELDPQWLSEIESVEPGEYSGIIDAEDGFAILLVRDRIQAGEDEQIQLSAIVMKKRSLEDEVHAYLETVEVKRYVGKE